MADKKISELTTITGANTASGDLFVIVDVDANETKKITRDELTNALELTDFDNIDINGGTIDGTPIGGSTPAAGTFTTLTANGNVVLGDAATDTVTVTADVASDLIPSVDGSFDLGASGAEWQDLFIDGTANIDSLVADTADINGGTIDGVTIGGASAGAGTFTTLAASSPASFAAGTAALPSITRTGDTNTGMFFPAADTIAFSEGGAERMRITSTGNVGIGTSSPSTRLTVVGNENATFGQFNILATGAGADAQIAFFTSLNGRGMYVDDSDSNKFKIYTGLGKGGAGEFTIDNLGNVGIGTSSPQAKLEVDGGVSTTFTNCPINVTLVNRGTIAAGLGAGINFSANFDGAISTTYATISGMRENATSGNSAGILTFGVRDSGAGVNIERLRITAAGNVGIGTTSPNASALLDVQSTTKGVRMPNMTTTQKNAIASPAAGLMVFDTTLSKLSVYSGVAWETITSV